MVATNCHLKSSIPEERNHCASWGPRGKLSSRQLGNNRRKSFETELHKDTRDHHKRQ